MLETVLSALRGGDTVAAVQAATTWVTNEPTNAEAHHLLGLALQQGGELRHADLAFARALELAPERAALHLGRARLAVQAGAFDRARAGFVEALKHDPNQLMAYLGLAELAVAARQLEQAEQHLRFAERIAPEHPHLDALWAQVQLARGEGAAALRRMQFASERVPGDAVVLGVLGLCYLNQRHFAFAEQALGRALETQPRQRTLRFALIDALLNQGRHDEGARHAAILIEQMPEDVRALTLAGQIAADRGDSETALRHLRDSLRRAPAQPRALDPLLATHVARGEIEAANAFLDEILQQHPQLDFVWSALVALQGEDATRGAAAALRWIAARPDHAAAHEVAAQLLEAQGDAAQAETLAQRALQLQPHSVGANLVLVRQEIAAGRADAACERLARLRAELDDAAMQMLLAGWHATACEAAGRPDEAARHWAVANPEFDASTPPAVS